MTFSGVVTKESSTCFETCSSCPPTHMLPYCPMMAYSMLLPKPPSKILWYALLLAFSFLRQCGVTALSVFIVHNFHPDRANTHNKYVCQFQIHHLHQHGYLALQTTAL